MDGPGSLPLIVKSAKFRLHRASGQLDASGPETVIRESRRKNYRFRSRSAQPIEFDTSRRDDEDMGAGWLR